MRHGISIHLLVLSRLRHSCQQNSGTVNIFIIMLAHQEVINLPKPELKVGVTASRPRLFSRMNKLAQQKNKFLLKARSKIIFAKFGTSFGCEDSPTTQFNKYLLYSYHKYLLSFYLLHFTSLGERQLP